MLPFDPAGRLALLCRRHGLPDAAGARFLPLLERASHARPYLRRRVLSFVERQLQRLAKERAEARLETAAKNEACLRALAPLLHTWRPDRAG